MPTRAYNGISDLQKIQAFMSELAAENGRCGLIHPGDVPHRLYNNLRMENPSDILRLWEDENGRLLAWSLIYPRYKGIDFFLRPECWDNPLALEVLRTAESALQAVLKEREIVGKLNSDIWQCEQRRIALMQAQGWRLGDASAYIYTMRSLDLPIPPLQLPEGFTIRSARGVEEAEKLAEVHKGGFGTAWTEETYRKVTLSPGYDAEREIVVVAPDGRFAAFCVIWFDPVNKIGLFEPVAAHGDFRRMRLTTQLMYEAMRRMKAAGMDYACVSSESDNEASQGLYKSVGFEPQHEIYTYEKSV